MHSIPPSITSKFKWYKPRVSRIESESIGITFYHKEMARGCGTNEELLSIVILCSLITVQCFKIEFFLFISTFDFANLFVHSFLLQTSRYLCFAFAQLLFTKDTQSKACSA